MEDWSAVSKTKFYLLIGICWFGSWDGHGGGGVALGQEILDHNRNSLSENNFYDEDPTRDSFSIFMPDVKPTKVSKKFFDSCVC